MRLATGILLIICVLFANQASAQRKIINMADHDDKAYYFGLTFGMNFSTYRVKFTQSFAEHDSFKTINTSSRPGFNLGLMGNLRLNSFVDLRFNPCLAFAEKAFHMEMTDTNGTVSTADRTIEAIYMHMPLQLKFKSDRIYNFRFYALAGGKFDIDLAANARSRRRDEFIKVKPFDAGYPSGPG